MYGYSWPDVSEPAQIKKSKYDPGPDEETSGGRALRYYSSVRLKLAAHCPAQKQESQIKKEVVVEGHATSESKTDPVINPKTTKSLGIDLDALLEELQFTKEISNG